MSREATDEPMTNQKFLEVPWKVDGSTIIVDPCPIGEECPQATPFYLPGPSTHTSYRGHLVCESIDGPLARYIVEIHNARVPRGAR